MKVYQCIRAYDPYIPAFESKYKVRENNYSFNELRDLLIQDGFASLYILKPAFEKDDDFFFTLWNYETLQFKWAEENGLKTKNLDEIRIAQIESFKPEVYYNFSTYYDNKYLQSALNQKDLFKVCWDATIGSYYPPVHGNYDLRATLFEPYFKYWNQHGYNSILLSPAIPDSWRNLPEVEKDIDILFYGQINDYYFSARNHILENLLKWNKQKNYHLRIHLQLPRHKRPLINIGRLRNFARWLPPASRELLKNALPPIYGQELYETINRSRIVINTFGNYNGIFKENMRNYESTGCGALLVSEDGVYPDHFIPNKDFFIYRSDYDLFKVLDQVLSQPDLSTEIATKTKTKMQAVYSKQEQWNKFEKAVKSFS
jgi:hypothetical protein